MKLKLFVIILVSVLLFISYRRPDNKGTETGVFNVSFDQCKDLIEIKLSDLVEECRLVPLETTDESVLDQYPLICTVANYIITADRNGLYKFTREGRFIKKLLSPGKGPFDLPLSFTFFVNEKNNRILFNDRLSTEKLKVYDYEAERFLDPIKKSAPGYWGAFTIYNDSLILASMNPVLADTTSYALFLQNFKGQLVSSITSGKKLINRTRKTEQVQRLEVCTGNKDTYVHYTYDDTLFRYNPGKLSPYVIVSYKTSRTFLKGTPAEEGESMVRFPSVDNNAFMLFYELIFLGMTPIEKGGMKANYTQNYFFLNKSDGSFSRIRTYTDNITGKVQEGSGDWPIVRSLIPVLMQGDKFYIIYEANNLKNVKLNDELLRKMPAGTANKLQEILKNLNEMDNPVLLIGTIKKNVKIS